MVLTPADRVAREVLAGRIREALHLASLNMTGLSHCIGVPEPRVSRLLRGERPASADELARIAQATGVSAELLAGDSPIVQDIPGWAPPVKGLCSQVLTCLVAYGTDSFTLRLRCDKKPDEHQAPQHHEPRFGGIVWQSDAEYAASVTAAAETLAWTQVPAAG